MNIGFIVQARMGSTRLPGKILKEFYQGQTLLEVLLGNLHKIEDAKVIVATSKNPNDDELEIFLKSKGELVYRGSENDVLSRFIKAAEDNNVDGIVRICSDNPFIDFKGVEALVEKAKESKADYIGYRINNLPSIKTHFGFWGEFVTLGALKRVVATTDEILAHEHVTIYIYTHPEEYKCEWIECPDFFQGRDDIRLTIDTVDDMTNAKKVFSALKNSKPDFGLIDIVNYLDQHAELKESMKIIINQNTK